MGYCYFNEDGEILYNSETFGMTFWIDNNNDFCLDFKDAAKNGIHLFPMVLNNPSANYCKKDTQNKAFHRQDSHIIEQYCEVYGIKNPTLKCYMSTSLDCISER